MRSDTYKWLDDIQDRHWWVKARKEIVINLFEKYLDSGSLDILEIGFGTGGVLEAVSRYGKTWGMDNAEAVEYTKKRYPSDRLREGRLPDKVSFPENSFDRLIMLDVLEHIEDDFLSLKKTAKLLRSGGILFLTVPAFNFLWSKHDEDAMHMRRYSRGEIIQKLKEAGFDIVKCSYFNTFLFAPIVIAKLSNKIKAGSLEKRVLPRVIENLFYNIFRSEKMFLDRFSLPFGISIVCIAQKNK